MIGIIRSLAICTYFSYLMNCDQSKGALVLFNNYEPLMKQFEPLKVETKAFIKSYKDSGSSPPSSKNNVMKIKPMPHLSEDNVLKTKLTPSLFIDVKILGGKSIDFPTRHPSKRGPFWIQLRKSIQIILDLSEPFEFEE